MHGTFVDSTPFMCFFNPNKLVFIWTCKYQFDVFKLTGWNVEQLTCKLLINICYEIR